MSGISLKTSLGKSFQAKNDATRNKRYSRGGSVSPVNAASVVCLLSGLFLLAALSVAGEINETLQRIGLALVFIPVFVLGLRVNFDDKEPGEKSRNKKVKTIAHED